MTQALAGSIYESIQRAELRKQRRFQLIGRHVQIAPAETVAIRIARVCADGYPVLRGQRHRARHHERVAGMRAARHVDRRNKRNQRFVLAHPPRAIALTNVAVEIDAHARCYRRPMAVRLPLLTLLSAIALSCAGPSSAVIDAKWFGDADCFIDGDWY